jgi:hypothetical protein
MQLGGALFAGVLAAAGLMLLSLEFGFVSWTVGLVIVLSFGRSVLHYRAGRALVHGAPLDSVDRPLSATRRYVALAIVHSAVGSLVLSLELGAEVLALTAIAAAVYGVVGGAIAMYTMLPLFTDERLLGVVLDGDAPLMGVAVMARVGAALALPVATLALLFRAPPARARARYRESDG